MNILNSLSPAQATLLAAVVSAIATLIVCLLNNKAQNNRYLNELKNQNADREKAQAARDAEREKSQAVRDARHEMWMQNVDRKLDIHNGYAEKFSEISLDIAVIKNDIKTLYNKGE